MRTVPPTDFSVTVLIGVTDEAEALKTTVNTVMNTCSGEDIYKILIVRSQNATAACVAASAEMEKAYPEKVVCMVQKRPFVGGAIRDGFDTAQSSHILLLPGDLAIDLASVPLLIEKEKVFPAGIVKTSRMLEKHSFHHYSALRRRMNSCAQLFLRALFHTKLTDLTNPVQIMPAALYRSIRWQELNFPFLLEMVLAPLRVGAAFLEVPAGCRGREEGVSKNTILQTALYLRTALRIRFTKPDHLLISNERSGKSVAGGTKE